MPKKLCKTDRPITSDGKLIEEGKIYFIEAIDRDIDTFSIGDMHHKNYNDRGAIDVPTPETDKLPFHNKVIQPILCVRVTSGKRGYTMRYQHPTGCVGCIEWPIGCCPMIIPYASEKAAIASLRAKILKNLNNPQQPMGLKAKLQQQIKHSQQKAKRCEKVLARLEKYLDKDTSFIIKPPSKGSIAVLEKMALQFETEEEQ